MSGLELVVKGSMDLLLRDLDRKNKQVRFAAVVALTKTAVLVRKELQGEILRVFDRPTRYTLNSMYVKPATKQLPEAHVGHKDKSYAGKGNAAGDYLKPQIHGGTRPLKRSERLLQQRGLLPPGMYVVPGQGIKLDGSGNVSLGQMQQILSGLGAQFDSYQNTSRKNKAKRKYFVANIRGTLAVWERLPAGVRPLLVFVKPPQYRQRYDFFGLADRTANRHLPRQFDQALRQVMATAR